MALIRLPEAVHGLPSPALAPSARVDTVAMRSILGRLAVVLGDLGGIAVAFAVAQRSGGPDARTVLLSLIVTLAVFNRYRLFDSHHIASRREEVGRAFHAVGLSVGLTAVTAGIFGAHLGPRYLVVLLTVAMPLVMLEREALRWGFTEARRRGHFARPVFIAGAGAEAAELAEMFDEAPELGYRVLGYVGAPRTGEPGIGDWGLELPMDDEVATRVRAAGGSGVVVAASDMGLDSTNDLVRQLDGSGLHVEVASSLLGIDPGRLALRPLGRHAVIYVEPVVRTGWRSAAKRAFDISLSVTGLLVSLPVLLVAAAAVKLTSRGPVIFSQERIGQDGQPFRIYKLRSMVVGAEEMRAELLDQNEADGPLFKIRRDPRLTAVGAVLRRLCIDEVPQLVNVLRGDMSIVGPRPALPSELDGWTPRLAQRLRVKPGVTGLWQVNRHRWNRFIDYERLDLYYVDNWSLWRDVAVVLRTATVPFRGAAH
ncbi:MAG: hypothetical protein QOE35_648 [Actinomycetota bacterium]|jgi:exopolysaccharide biosynthesis polyprenyl glycosylphosphotransferase